MTTESQTPTPPTQAFLVAPEKPRSADLPEKKLSFWQLAGPGAILVGLSIGAGEIMLWPYLIDKFGPGIAWAAGIGVFLQLWINLEIARYTVATGETAYTALGRVSRWLGPVFILFNIFGWIAPAWAMASGLSLKALLVGTNGWGSGAFWTTLTFGLVALALFGPKVVYAGVEKSVSFLVLIITVGLLAVALAIGRPDDWTAVGTGLISFGSVPEGLDIKTLFIAITAAGAAGTANLFYGFYLRDKHIGMGALMPEMKNPLRDRVEKEPTVGFLYPESPENAVRFRAWMRHVAADQSLFFWGLNSFTIFLFIFVATAILRDSPALMEQNQVIGAQADALSAALPGIMGKAFRALFLLVGFATLFSTQIALVDGVARSISEILYVQFPASRRREHSWWYLVIAVTWMICSASLAAYLETQGITQMGFLFNAAYVGGICMAVYAPILLWVNRTKLPVSARPGALCTVMATLAALFYVVFSAASLWWEFGPKP